MKLVATASAPVDPAAYLETAAAVQRLHRGLLLVIQDALDDAQRRDVTPVQALLLHALGDDEVTAGEIVARGYYQGTNASYNLHKLIAAGLIEQRRSQDDRRSVHVRLSPQGQAVRALIDALYARHAHILPGAGGISAAELATLGQLMTRLERFFTHLILYRL